MATPFNMVSGDAQRALEEFSAEFDAALAVADPSPWSRMFGLYNSSRAIKTTYPIPLSAAKYRLRDGDDKYRSLYERSISMTPVEWQDGVMEKALIIEAPDFIGWAGEPERIAREGARQPNVLVAEMLAANDPLGLYADPRLGVASTINLFDDTHPVNIFDTAYGTFSNDSTASAVDVAMLTAVKTKLRARKGPNGQVMGLRVTHVLVPGALEEQVRDLLENDQLVIAIENQAATDNVGGASVNNRHRGTVEIVVADELLNDDELFFIDRGARCYPWIIQDGGAPEEIRFDRDSETYKREGKLGVGYVMLMAVAAALPQAIERVTVG
jgi:hypothetical protein